MMLLTLEQNKSRGVYDGRKQKLFCWCQNKTKAMLLMPEQNKSHDVDTGKKQKLHIVDYRTQLKPCFWCWNTTKVVSSMPEQNKDYVADAGIKQKPYCWCWKKPKATLLIWEENMLMPDKKTVLFMPKQNKGYVVDAGTTPAMLLMSEESKINQLFIPATTSDFPRKRLVEYPHYKILKVQLHRQRRKVRQ